MLVAKKERYKIFDRIPHVENMLLVFLFPKEVPICNCLCVLQLTSTCPIHVWDHMSPCFLQTAACLGCVTPILQDGADLRRVANMAAKLLEEKLDSLHTFPSHRSVPRQQTGMIRIRLR